MPRYRKAEPIRVVEPLCKGGKMKLCSKDVLKSFAALVILGMVGAVFTTPVTLGNLGAYYYYKHSKEGGASVDDINAIMRGSTNILRGGLFLWEVSEAGAEAGLLAAGVATGGVALIAIGTFTLA